MARFLPPLHLAPPGAILRELTADHGHAESDATDRNQRRHQAAVLAPELELTAGRQFCAFVQEICEDLRI